jgi:hypothetical protein
MARASPRAAPDPDTSSKQLMPLSSDGKTDHQLTRDNIEKTYIEFAVFKPL